MSLETRFVARTKQGEAASSVKPAEVVLEEAGLVVEGGGLERCGGDAEDIAREGEDIGGNMADVSILNFPYGLSTSLIMRI